MAPLSPVKDFSGAKVGISFTIFNLSLNNSLAETPPAMQMDLVSGYFSRAFWRFFIRISVAVFSKEAAKSFTCCSVKRFLSSWEGKEIGFPTAFWTSLRTAVLRPEKEKSRSLYLVSPRFGEESLG